MSFKVLRRLGELFNESGNLQLDHGIIVSKRSRMEVFLHESPVLPEPITIWKSREHG
jgi:hypothetical protein